MSGHDTISYRGECPGLKQAYEGVTARVEYGAYLDPFLSLSLDLSFYSSSQHTSLPSPHPDFLELLQHCGGLLECLLVRL